MRGGRRHTAAEIAAWTCVLVTSLSATRQSVRAATVRGVVVSDGANAEPLGGAIVTLSGSALPRAVSAVTDVNGRFLFDRLPAGQFTISASKSPYVSMAYGAKRPGRPGTPLRLAEGEGIADVVLRLPRGAVIAGTIQDQAGEPVSDVPVTALRVMGDTAAVAGSATTDDVGNYRIFGLTAGEYVVVATRRLAGAGSLTLMSVEEMDRRLAALERPGLATTSYSPQLTSSVQSDTYAVAPVFYPGTTDVAAASRIQLASGDEERASFLIGPVSAGAVQGVVRTADGSPLPVVALELERVGPSLPLTYTASLRLTLRPQASSDGRFRFEGVTPGRYVLSARTELARGAKTDLQWAASDITSSGQDIFGIALTLQPGVHLTGSLAADSLATAAHVNLSAIHVVLTMTSTETGVRPPLNLRIATAASAPVRADGTFDVAGIVPGSYIVSATGVGSAWLRSVVVDGQDALDVPVEFRAGTDRHRAVLIFSERRGELSGFLMTKARTPAVNFTIVVFPADQQLWRPHARRVRAVRPASDGRYVVADVPGGEYFVVALADVDPSDLDDPAFLAQLVPHAIRVMVREGERTTQNFALAQ